MEYLVVDLSDAAVNGFSVDDAINRALNIANGKKYMEEGYTEQKSTEFSLGFTSADLLAEHSFSKIDIALKNVFEFLTRKGNIRSVLVLDNLEHISDDEEALRELNAILIKVDNKDFSKYNVKVVVVGTPIGVEKFYRNVNHMDTISNRMEEIEEVGGLAKKEEVEIFLKKTFENQLNISFGDKVIKKYAKYIFEVTGGIPQRLHEYCLRLYYAIEDEGGDTDFRIHKIADREYLRESFQKYSTIIQKNMNSYETAEQRRNQVIYCLPKLKRLIFSTAEVEEVVRKQFVIAEDRNIQLSTVLSQLSEGENPLLSKSDNRWIVQDSQYLIAIRLLLEKKKGKVILKG